MSAIGTKQTCALIDSTSASDPNETFGGGPISYALLDSTQLAGRPPLFVTPTLTPFSRILQQFRNAEYQQHDAAEDLKR